MVYIGVKYLLLLSKRGFDVETCIFFLLLLFKKIYIRIRIRILLSNRGPTRGKVITVIHKQ